MIFQRTRGIRMLVALAQAGVVSLLFWLCFFALTQWVPGSEIFAHRYFFYWLAVLGGLALEVAVRGDSATSEPLFQSSTLQHFPITLRQVATSLGALLLLLVVAKDQAISRSFLLGFACTLYPALVWTNAKLPLWLARVLFTGERESETVLVGPASRMVRLEPWLARKQKFGVRVAGLIRSDMAGPDLSPETRCLGSIDDFESIIDRQRIAQVILLELPDPEPARRMIAACEQRGIRMIFVNDFAEQIHRPIVSRVDEGVNVITLFEEPLENPFNRILKRTLDLALALFVIAVVLPPLTVLVWLLQRVQSPGPLWHRQTRAGLQNKAFTILKFRTMHEHGSDVARPASADDERVFPAARWLRRFDIRDSAAALARLAAHASA